MKGADGSRVLAQCVHEVTGALPASEKCGLCAQMRSAVVSISLNIAEGTGRSGQADTVRFLQMAVGSASELESQLLVANRLALITDHDGILDHVDKVRRQLTDSRQT
jgi:four helix bundle protein